VPLYEVTDLFGNASDWASDFLLRLDEREILKGLLEGLVSVSQLPSSLKYMIQYGIENYLVEEAYQKLIAQELEKGFEITDGIMFTHSGAFMPMMGAIERLKPSGAKFDVHTLINYEGVYVDENMKIDNPSLKRIINVWGTATFLGNGDFGPPTLAMTNFQGANPGQIENINIRIIDAFHNDFSYDSDDYSGATTPSEQNRQHVNEMTNIFMRKLYARAAEDQTNPGRLEEFLSGTRGISYDPFTKVATVNPMDLVIL
jgi:hypothetical protein